jgi:dephospho-CoA kinase
VLKVGLTGGIGAGKSTVARRLAERGAVVVDADLVAREVVEPGTEGLAAVVEAFGQQVLGADGRLDRPALGRIVFGDDAARLRLNGILHPRIGVRTYALMAAAPPDAVVVHDVPLLVENRMGAAYHLVLVVHTPADERVRRLVEERGMAADDARARVAAQADDPARRAAADVWLDNTGAPDAVLAAVDRLWESRLLPFEENVRLRRRAPRPAVVEVVDADPTWPAQAQRLLARIGAALGDRALRLDHVGSTAVPGLPAKDCLDLQVVVADLAVADGARAALEGAGFAFRAATEDDLHGGGTHPKRLHVACDPGRQAHVHVREAASPAVREQLAFRDLLRAHPDEREAYAAVKRAAVAAVPGTAAGEERYDAYLEAKSAWVRAAVGRALA